MIITPWPHLRTSALALTQARASDTVLLIRPLRLPLHRYAPDAYNLKHEYITPPLSLDTSITIHSLDTDTIPVFKTVKKLKYGIKMLVNQGIYSDLIPEQVNQVVIWPGQRCYIL